MPLVGYHLIGFDKGPLSFTAHDLKLLASDRYQQRTADFFSKSPYDFNLFFHNGKWKGRTDYLLHGKIHLYGKDITEYQSKVKFFLDGKKQKPHAINVVFTNNRGNARFNIPMTPWIMAHRLGHIQMLHSDSYQLFSNTLQMGYDYLCDLYDYRLDTDGVPNAEHWNGHLRPYVGNPHADARVFHAFFIHLLTTRAAREHHVRPWFEYYSEWMAQFIRFNRLIMPEFFPDLDLDILCNEPDRPLVPFPKNKIIKTNGQHSTDEIRGNLEATYAGILKNWTGEIIVT